MSRLQRWKLVGFIWVSAIFAGINSHSSLFVSLGALAAMILSGIAYGLEED